MRTDKSTPMPASSPAIHTSEDPRHALIRQGRKLEYFTIVYNSLEGIVSIVAGCLQDRYHSSDLVLTASLK